MSESGEHPPNPTYQEIREEIAETTEPQEAKETSVPPDPAEATEGRRSVLHEQVEKVPSKRKWKQRLRKDIACEKCGKVFSSNTRRHLCVPKASGEAPNVAPPPPVSPRRQRSTEPRLTIDDVRTFLTEERTKYRAAQRDAWVGSLF
jgi:hypothetical protein